MKIGFIGLGIMGSRMAASLQRSGHDLVIHNRTRQRAEPLLAGGAAWAETPAALGAQVNVLFTMLAHPEAVRDMALGEVGFLEQLRAGALWVDCSTVNPSFSREMAAAAAGRGICFLDAPVTGSKGAAAKGELSFLVGGEAEDLETCRPLLASMGTAITHVGGHGMGSALKIVNNLLFGQAMAAFSEALLLGESLGLPRPILFDFFLGRGVAPSFIAMKRGKIETGDYEPEFPLRWMRKDLQLASTSAYEQGVAMPLTNAAKEIYGLAERYGLGEKDYSAIFAF